MNVLCRASDYVLPCVLSVLVLLAGDLILAPSYLDMPVSTT